MNKLDKLQSIAELCGGSATICDKAGRIIVSYPAVHEAGTLIPGISNLVSEAFSSNESLHVIRNDGVFTAVIVIGECALVFDNRSRMEDKLKYQQIIEESLPYIAQVAGGTAVLFDRNGVRFRAIQPDGKPTPGANGVFTRLSQQVMQELRPSLGPSTLSPRATAVRIPLSPDYGLAFNNTYATNQRQRLLDNARQYRYARYHIEDIIGESQSIAKAKQLAREVAKSMSTVLITGETGTGKEMFAQAIHNLSNRYKHPFIAINCGAIPADLVESTLFGYVEGAFSGAKKNGQPGAFEQANGGTLFLDEISEMPYSLQVKLLRVLQEREVTRVGDSKALPVDVRVIASTNKSLHDIVKSGKFRADLYFRLNVFEIVIPPLRERMDDIIALTDFILKKFSSMLGKNVRDITPGAMKSLSAYSWPGNVRELQNCLEYAFNIVDANSPSITLECLPAGIGAIMPDDTSFSLYDEHMNRAEKELVQKALALCGNNKAEAARRLGINRTTLWRIVKKYNLDNDAS